MGQVANVIHQPLCNADMYMQLCACSLRTRQYAPCAARFFPPVLVMCQSLHGTASWPATLLAASANLHLEIQICAVYLFQNVSVLPYHSVYESVLAFVEPLLLIFAEACPRFLDKTHPEPVTKKQITYRPSSSSPQLLLCVRRSRVATVC